MKVAEAIATRRPQPGGLRELAQRVREHILRLAARGGCFVGASLSCADILVQLYARTLRISPARCSDPDRDYLFLSKGHDVPALYATLVELGYLDRQLLRQHLVPGSHVYWHPNRGVPGVEFHSGSLGHLLSVALGVALDVRLRDAGNRVFVLLGDGELDEGSVWEACLVASGLRLDNLVAIVDRNGFQANGRTEEILPLEPLRAKFEAFGWACEETDGHDFAALDAALAQLPLQAGRPSVLLARTLRGKGVPSLEGRVDRWFARFTTEEAEGLIRELRGSGRARLGPGEMVR